MKWDQLTASLDLGHEEAIELEASHLFAYWGFGDGEMLKGHPASLRAQADALVRANFAHETQIYERAVA